jgi:hypothetical protein
MEQVKVVVHNEQSEIRRGFEALSSNTIILQKSKVQHMFNHNF